MTLPLNPYVAGNPVGDSPAFIGRADVLREVLRVLRHPQGNAIVLFGQRRIGKTSILEHLAVTLPEEGPYRPVYFDLQDKAEWPLERLLRDLARAIAHALGQPDPDLGDDTETTFRAEWLPVVLDDLPEGCSLVLLFDEFDVLADPQGKQAGAAFFPYLRKLLARDPVRLQFVFVIGRNVDDLDTIALSLFKGTPYQRVSLLSRADTADLVRLSEANDTLHWPDEAVEWIWQLTNGHPFLTQQLCSHVWERAYDEDDEVGRTSEVRPTLPADVTAAVPDALDASRNTLEWLWEGLPPAERVVASALAEAGSVAITQDKLEQLLHESGVRVVIRELQDAPRLLQEWDLIKPADGGYRFRVELLRQWIAERKPLRRVQEELDRIEPVAESLYGAASGLYRGGQLEQAVPLLRQAIGLNPNHVRANQLLADILLAQGQADEARELLERLYEYQPAAARPGLVRALLALAQVAEDDDEQLALYEQVLELNPRQPEATAGRKRIWQQRGDAALEKEDLEAAVEDYRQAGLGDKVAEVEREMRRRDLVAQLQKVEVLGQGRRYQDALALARELAAKYPEDREWQADLERLERKTQLADLYRRALEAWENDDRQTAQELFLQVISLEPGYEDATRYLHLAVTGEDIAELQASKVAEKAKLWVAIQHTKRIIAGFFIAGILLGIALRIGRDRLYFASLPSPVSTLPSPTSSATIPATLIPTLTKTPTVEPTPTHVPLTPTEQPLPTFTPTPTPTVVPTVAPNLWGLHQVCAGQTLFQIAETYSATVDDIVKINSIANRDQIATGRLLLVPWQIESSEAPNFVSHQVTIDDTLTSLADRYSTSVNAIQAVNGLSDPNIIYPGDELKIPVGLMTALRTNECVEFFEGKLDHPSELDVYLRSSPALDALQASLVVANGTPLQVLGQNAGISGGPWYKVTVEVKAGGYRTGWLRSLWVRLEESASIEDIPLIEW